MAREFFFNGDFDTTLRGRPSALDSGEPTYLHEMAVHFLFACEGDDSLILFQALPEDFIGYLAAKGIVCPRVVQHPAFTQEAAFTPFGWNAQAEALNRRTPNPTSHPDLEIVRAVNSRVFSRDLEKTWGGGVSEQGGLYASWEALEAGLAAQEAPPAGGWVIKAVHGHAGTANRRLRPVMESWDRVNRIAVQSFLEDGGQVVAEPWQDRLMDLGINFILEPGGDIHSLCGHELQNSRDGAFLGLIIHPSGRVPEPWADPLEAAARSLAAALHARGYFGPVSLDAYVWQAPGGSRLRPLVDINARYSMALPAHGWARRLPSKILCWTWFSSKKLHLPATYAELDARLGAWAFAAGRGTGILATSPLRLPPAYTEAVAVAAPVTRRARRVGFLFSADSEADLETMRRDFFEAVGKNQQV